MKVDWEHYAFISSMLTLVGASAVGAVLFGFFGGRDWLPVGLGLGFVVGLVAAVVVWQRIEGEARRQERAEREAEEG